MVRLLSIILVLIPFYSIGQTDTNTVIKPGLLRTQGTFSFGKLPKLDETGIYIHGNLEYYFDNNFSIRGDAFYHLKSDDFSKLAMNHQVYIGGAYHLKSGANFDPYIGIQPGIAITEASPIVPLELGGTYKKQSPVPTLLYSSIIGFNYYAENWFHLFVDLRLLSGIHKSEYNLNISEIRLSFGLGFNFNSK